MKIKLKNISKITGGVYAKSHSLGKVYYLQGRDFDEYNQLNSDLQPCLLMDANIEKHLLQKGDILVAVKGNNFFATVYKSEVEPAVASSIFIVLRSIDSTKIIPEFIAWYFNHQLTQKFLKSLAKGTSLPSINSAIVGDLEFNLLGIEKQKLILTVDGLKTKEKQLHHKIEELRDIIVNQQLIKLLNK